VSNAVVANCTPLSSVKTVIFTYSVNGSRVGAYFTGIVHRAAVDTITRVSGSSGDSLRIHNGNGTAADTTTFADSNVTAKHFETAIDSVRGITFWIPRNIHPFPTAGMFVRNVTVHAEYSKNGTTVTRDVVRRVEVDFPADAQGNVVLKINAQTCNLNLVTHHVSNCH